MARLGGTILPDGSRATSRRPVARDRNIYVFGDSWIFGWGLDDELTMAWHLQNEFRDRFAVTSFAYAGYGNLQALLSFRRIKHKIRADDILLFGYAGFYLVRSAATPAVLTAFADMFASYKTQSGLPLMHPKATLMDGRLQVKLLPLYCAQIAEICAGPKPSLEAIYDMTKAIFDEIIASTDAQIVVLNLDGWDGDKVIEHLVSKRIPVVDGRAKANLFTKDTVGAYEPHPGPFAHHYWYKEVTKAIEKLEVQPRDRDS